MSSNSVLAGPEKVNEKMISSFDLAKYLQKIGYSGPQTPTLDVLRALHQCHAQSIAFENLNPFLGIPVVLELDAVYQKLILNRRGGYCFEHNLLFGHVLKSIGFAVKGLAARVRWNVKDEIVTARGHMLLHVQVLGRPFIADVGFGGLTLTAPLAFEVDVEQKTPHETFRIGKKAEDFILEAHVGGIWKPVYSFTTQENFPIDYEVTNWYLSTHPGSHFRHNVIAALPFPNGRYALRNGEFSIYDLNGGVQRQSIADIQALKEILNTRFAIDLPDVAALDSKLEQVIRPSSATA